MTGTLPLWRQSNSKYRMCWSSIPLNNISGIIMSSNLAPMGPPGLSTWRRYFVRVAPCPTYAFGLGRLDPEGGWTPAVWRGPPYVFLGGPFPKEGWTACMPRPSRKTTGSHVGLLGVWYMLASVGNGGGEGAVMPSVRKGRLYSLFSFIGVGVRVEVRLPRMSDR